MIKQYNSMTRALVNGLSPQIVFPGSKLTIRGENLGEDIDDIINLWICGEDCKPFIESRSDTKIVCYVGKNPLKDDPFVIVVTKSGGEGECNIKLNITVRVDRVPHDVEVPLWMEENNNFQTEAVISPRDRSLSNSHQKNLFGSSVPFKSLENTSESDPTSSLFDPVKYLLNNHRDVTISDLQSGVSYLEVECGTHTSSDIEFVKTHIDVLLACHDTLQKVNKLIDEEEENSTGGSLTGPLDTVLNECNKCAELLFSSILNKKDKADRIRNALNVIDRFRFLFGLPDSIDRNIHSKAYDIVLNDYKKAKSLFADTQVHVFQQVMDGVHGKIRAFSRELQERLLEPRCPLIEKKQLLKYLVEFEGSPTNDPAWESLQKQQEKVIQYLTKSKMEFKGKLLEFVRIEQIKATRVSHKENSISPLFNQFIDELCDTVTQSLPDYWSLCQAYLDGSLFPEVKKQPLVHQDSFMSPPPTPYTIPERQFDHEEDIHRLVGEVMELLSSIIRQYCITMDFKFNSEKDVEYAVEMVCKARQFWTPPTVKRIKMCVERLLAINIPLPCVLCTVDLVQDMQRLCVKCLFESAEVSIRELHSRENWEISQERGHTALPLLFQNMVLSLLSTVKEVMEPIRYRENLSQESDINNCIQEMFYSVVISFADCLKDLTDIIESENSERDAPALSTEKLSQANVNTTKEERLVLILGNCRHTILTTIPTLLETFKSHGYISANDDTIDNKSLERYSTLERSIFDKYVNSKDAFLFGDILQFLEPGAFPWAYCNPPVSINIFVQELALKLVMAQAELHNIEKDLLKRIIGHLLQNVTVKVCGMISKVERFCKNGALQARLDVLACLLLFRNNMTSKCRTTMEDTLNSIPTAGISTEDEAMLTMLLDRFKVENSVLLSCLDYTPAGDKQFSPIDDEVLEPVFKRDVVGLERAPTIRRYETLERAPSLRRAMMQGHGSGDSIGRRRSQKRLVKSKAVRSPPVQSKI
ncbi:hypothetical protein ACHWQZ_G016208 [Mnemiopsis leidyi]